MATYKAKYIFYNVTLKTFSFKAIIKRPLLILFDMIITWFPAKLDYTNTVIKFWHWLQDDTRSVSLSSQQETVECMYCKQKYGLYCDGDLNAHVVVQDVTVWATVKYQVLPEIKQNRSRNVWNDAVSLRWGCIEPAEKKTRDKKGQKARSCLSSFFIQMELFTWNSSQNVQL